jgi:hypothetical protein
VVEKMAAAKMALETALVECLRAYDHPHIEAWMEGDGFRQESTGLLEPEWVLEG